MDRQLPIYQILTEQFQINNNGSKCCVVQRLTWEVDSEARLGDVEVGLELDGDHIEGAVDALGQQGSAHLSQGHLILRWPVPHLQDVMGRLCVKRQELEARC